MYNVEILPKLHLFCGHHCMVTRCFCVVVVVVGQCDIVERSLSLEVHSVSARCILKYVQLAQCVDIVFLRCAYGRSITLQKCAHG